MELRERRGCLLQPRRVGEYATQTVVALLEEGAMGRRLRMQAAVSAQPTLSGM